MDKLKLYAAPLIAIVLLLVWFLLFKPKLDDGALDDAPADAPAKSDAKSDAKSNSPE